MKLKSRDIYSMADAFLQTRGQRLSKRSRKADESNKERRKWQRKGRNLKKPWRQSIDHRRAIQVLERTEDIIDRVG